MKRIILAVLMAAAMAPAAQAGKVNAVAIQCGKIADSADQSFGAPLGDQVYSACMQGGEHGKKGDTARHDKTVRILKEQAATMRGMDRAAFNQVIIGYEIGFTTGTRQPY